jgi:hypothetical protein
MLGECSTQANQVLLAGKWINVAEHFYWFVFFQGEASARVTAGKSTNASSGTPLTEGISAKY